MMMRKQLFTLILALMLVRMATGQNQNLSEGYIFEGEPFLAINPANPSNIVVAWMGFVFQSGTALTIKVRSSFDGGSNWSDPVIMPHMAPTYKSADPTMLFDGAGNLFLAYIDHRESPDSGGVYLFKSTDGGLHWGNPVQVIDIHADGDRFPIDRPWLTGNLAGDSLYMTTKPAPWVLPPNRAYFMASTDSGSTWSPWRYLDSTGYLIGSFMAQPMAAPASHGNWFGAIYPSFVLTQNLLPQYILAYTTNAGAGFSYRTVYAGSNTASNDSAKLGYRFLVNPADRAHLVFLFFHKPFGDIDLMMTESFDAGVTWTQPARVNDDPSGNNRMQDMVWADFDTNGDLVVTWRDRRNGTGPGYDVASEMFAAYRHRDSAHFAPNFRISDSLVPYQAILVENGNDFMGVALQDDTLYAAWGSVQDGSLDIWFMKVAAATGTTTGMKLIGSEQRQLLLKQGSEPGVYAVSRSDHRLIDRIRVYDISGKRLMSVDVSGYTVTMDLRSHPDGIFILDAISAGEACRTKLFKGTPTGW